MENFMDFIIEKALVLIPVLFILGAFLKKTPKLVDWIIPWVLLVVGVAGGIALVGDPLQGILQGVLVTGATVLGHQLIKQTVNRE
ncbi:phage holin family protein [Paenibacillus sp. GXUN7292]|uniref:phage holin family protein n=1 Tax=Paenibacillus sp. GXUN7292 TaxID=3422499 RepID=UPI003D7E608D